MNHGKTRISIQVRLGLLSILIASCTPNHHGRDSGPLTAHVLPLQEISLSGFLDEDTTGGFVRYEGAHFAYEVPVSANKPLTAIAPIYLTGGGRFGSGPVQVSWVPTESPEGPVIFAARGDAPAHRDDAVSLDLELEVAVLPRFEYTAKPGVLFRAFTAGTLAALGPSYDAMLGQKDLPADVRADFAMQRKAGEDALMQALVAIDRVRSSSAEEPIGPLSLEDDAVDASLSLESLELADRLIAGFLTAARAGVWQPTGAAARPAQYGVGLSAQALTEDLVTEATNWVPKLLMGTISTLQRVQQFARVFGVVGTVGAAALGIVGSAAAVPLAVNVAIGVTVLTVVPAVTIAALRVGQSWFPQPATPPPAGAASRWSGLANVVGRMLNNVGNFAMTLVQKGSTLGKTLGNVIPSSASWKAPKSAVLSWFKRCAADPTSCVQSDAGVSNGGSGGGGSGGGGGGGGGSGGGGGGAGDGGVDADAATGQCGQQQASGADAPETFVYDVGTVCGSLTVDYDMQTVADRVIVKYDGATVADSGCVSGADSLKVDFCGQTSTELTVEVEPNCQQTTGTAWSFTLNCP